MKKSLEKKNMQCLQCESGKYVARKRDLEVSIPSAPTVLVSGIEFFECDHCDDQLLDAQSIESRDIKVLMALIKFYANTSHEMNGHVFDWIRKKIRLTLPKFIEETRTQKDESAYYQAKTRSTNIDHWDKTVLLLLAHDFVHGTTKGHEHIKAIARDLLHFQEEEVTSVRIAAQSGR